MTERITNFLKGVDDFPQKITLKYNKAGSYPSVQGGIISLIVWIAFYWWLANTIKDWVTNPLTDSSSIIMS